MKKNFNGFYFFLVIAFGIFVLPYLLTDEDFIDINYSSFIKRVEAEEIVEVSEVSPYLLAVSTKKEKLRTKMLSSKLIEDKSLMDLLREKSVEIKSDDIQSFNFLFWLTGFLPMILLGMFFYFMSRKMGPGKMAGMNMHQGDIGRKSDKKITFANVAGLLEAKRDLMEIVEFLKTPFKFTKLGAKIPKGLLMVGEPGTGKTLLAKAVAGEAGVPFFNVSGSEFVEMFVGVGASRVRDLFNKAKRHAPCIVFIDEIDAVARKRGSGYGGGNDEREQTLNQLLIEMDGFSENQNVIVIAATNRETVLDRAILRPGRFDRKVVVDNPSLKERLDILLVHSKNKPLGPSVKLDKVARKTAGMVGADLENIMNESAIIAARSNAEKITNKHIEEAVERVIAGPERKSKVMSDKEKEIVAYHESGHALIAHMLPNTEPIHKISIIPRGRAALGYMLQLPNEDKFLWSKEDFLNEIKILMGGRVAEELTFKDVTSGASNDIEKATKIAKNMVSIYGMSSEIGPQALEYESEIELRRQMPSSKEFSEETAKKLDREVKDILSFCYNESKRLIKENIDKLKLLADHLLREEIIFEDEITKIIGVGV